MPACLMLVEEAFANSAVPPIDDMGVLVAQRLEWDSKTCAVESGRLAESATPKAHPLKHGYLCPIGAATTELAYHPDRLKYPQRGIGPRGSRKWERISWDEALDEIAEKVLDIDHVGAGRQDSRCGAPLSDRQARMLEWGYAIEHTPNTIQTIPRAVDDPGNHGQHR